MSKQKKILIVGSVAGGASAAAKARRLSEDATIILFERGEYISFANCGLPYHIGGHIPQRSRLLVLTPQALHQRFNIDVRTRSEVNQIDRENRTVLVHDIAEGRQYSEPYDVLILSPGAESIRPPIPGIDSPRVFSLRNMTDMDAIKHTLDRQKPVCTVVIGGGYIGLEMAEALVHYGTQVALVELTGQVMGPIDPEMAFPLHQELRRQGVDLRLHTSVTAIHEQDDNLELELSDGKKLQCGMAILAVGVRPEVALAKQANLDIGEHGGIVVDDHMRTNDPHIYAVGDAVEVTDFVGGFATLVPLAGPANRQGRIAAINALGGDIVYKHTQGTAICKVFDLAVGMTGMSEKTLKRTGRFYEKVYLHRPSHATYYPGAVPIHLKLLFDPEKGAILGAQAVGRDAIDKCIDVIAVAMRAGLTVQDLQDLELCYAPPFGSAKDPVNYAGFVATNVINGDMPICHAEDLQNPSPDQMLLDVRTIKEFNNGSIPGAINIPVDELRERLKEIPEGKDVLVFCETGVRSYISQRLMLQRGYQSRNLTGGYLTYKARTDHQ